MNNSPGENWIHLLHGYAPVMENAAMTAEHIGRLEKRTGIPRISFIHPGKELLLSVINPEHGESNNVILTGTAGDGKTSLCFELFSELTGGDPDRSSEIQTIHYETMKGLKRITFIFDVTAWRKPVHGYLPPEQVEILASLAQSVFEESDDFFVVAVNDGQLHEVFEYLPAGAPENIHKLRKEISRLHVSGVTASESRLHLINLSTISSEVLMERSLNAILDRKEWECLDTESENPLFSPKSSLHRNYKLLRTPTVRSRLITLAMLADAVGFHMPIRGILCLIANALLGNPAAKDKVLRPQQGLEAILEESPHEAALHRTLFGDHLSPVARNKREVYRFLSMLQIGLETTNDLDDLLIFGHLDEDYYHMHTEIVENDPFHQRNPSLPALIREYVRGDLSPEETNRLLCEMSAERRRLFLTVDEKTLRTLKLWRSSVFHHAGDYIDKLLMPLRNGKQVAPTLLQKLVAGLNRAWTGLLITNQPDELYLCTGLDVTTAAVSDILCDQIQIYGSDTSKIAVVESKKTQRPEIVITTKGNSFSIPLTLTRFEFLCRVSDGAMPSTFSRESAEDFSMLKQRCIASLCGAFNSNIINGIRITPSGKIERTPILLSQS